MGQKDVINLWSKMVPKEFNWRSKNYIWPPFGSRAFCPITGGVIGQKDVINLWSKMVPKARPKITFGHHLGPELSVQ
jgi:hypothetical protein